MAIDYLFTSLGSGIAYTYSYVLAFRNLTTNLLNNSQLRFLPLVACLITWFYSFVMEQIQPEDLIKEGKEFKKDLASLDLFNLGNKTFLLLNLSFYLCLNFYLAVNDPYYSLTETWTNLKLFVLYLILTALNSAIFIWGGPLITEMNLRSLQIKLESKRNQAKVLWEVLYDNWFKISNLLFAAVLTSLSKSFVLPYLFDLEQAEILSLFNFVSQSSLVILYLVRAGLMAKASDVLGDIDVDNKDLRKVDRLCDVAADGTINKLLVFILLENLFWLSEFKEDFYSLLWSHFFSICGLWIFKQASNAFSYLEVYMKFVFLLSLNWFIDFNYSFTSFLSVVALLAVSSPLMLDRLPRKLLEHDFGFLGLYPFMASCLCLAINNLVVKPELSSCVTFGSSLMTLLLIFDQAGFIFDLMGDKEEHFEVLDVLGNQFKSLFKFYLTKVVFLNFDSSFVGVLPESFNFNILSTLIFIFGSAFIFYHFTSDLDRKNFLDSFSKNLEGKFHLNFLLLNLLVVGDLNPHLLDFMILSGGVADNLKKAYKLELVPLKKEVIKREIPKVVYLDLIGDFNKDVLYPLVLSRHLLDVFNFLILWIFINLKQFGSVIVSQISYTLI